MDFVDFIQTPKLDNVRLHSQLKEPLVGNICLTFSHLIFSSKKNFTENSDEYELWVREIRTCCGRSRLFYQVLSQLLHQNIDTVERKPHLINQQLVDVPGKGHQLILKCKDLRIVTIEIATAHEFLNVASSIEQLSSIRDPKHLYAFYYRPMYSLLENGFTMFRPEIEYSKLLATEEWRISIVNKSYDCCPTYSSSLVVPKVITDEQLVEASKFRELGRFPLLSYRHENGAVMMKSSQPCSSHTKRCRADEAILNCILGKSQKGFIVDTWGGGKNSSKCTSENEQHYSQWKKVVRPIANFNHPSGILDSFSKVVEACNDTTSTTEKWLSRLESSGWLTLVLNALNTSCIVAQCLAQDNAPVLVHGGKGLDSTLIVTSLVQIILNPDCRTVRGLQALIDREWLQSGHPFATRHSQSCYTSPAAREKTSGASFVLFLDCCHQLYTQFPLSFEFDSHLLITLFEHSYFSQYGTFIANSEAERIELMAFTKTTSLWSHLNRPDVMTSLLNPAYEPNQNILWPSVAPLSLVLWSELYLRFVVENTQGKRISQQIQTMISTEKELRSRVVRLRKQLTDLQREYEELSGEVKSSNGNSGFSNTSLLNGAI